MFLPIDPATGLALNDVFANSASVDVFVFCVLDDVIACPLLDNVFTIFFKYDVVVSSVLGSDGRGEVINSANMDDEIASSSLDNDDSSNNRDFGDETVDDGATVSCAIRVAITSFLLDDINTSPLIDDVKVVT